MPANIGRTRILHRIITAMIACLWAAQAAAFCGFYVAQDDGPLYNEGSKVVFARDGNRSTITMASDYRGAPSDFALIVPTPTVLPRPRRQQAPFRVSLRSLFG